VQDRLAEAILNGDVEDGQRVLVDAGDAGLLLVPELEGEIIAPAAAA
jgi:ATP-dependent Clp protease ATP-binding subunit ClpB